MALTVSSPRVFNGNVGKQAYNTSSPNSGSKCLCCPYGYHIDLDFVEYCEAVAAGNTDKNSIERRKKRERRRQCQSMEILLGLVSPTISGSEHEISGKSQEPAAVTNGVTTLPRSGHVTIRSGGNNQPSATLDLSDVVGDFEATLQRLSKPSKNHHERKNQTETNGTTIACPIHPIHVDQTTDFDAASIGSGNSNLSTGALQNIREQMAISLERMKELEEQVKIIPMLQVQVSVLKEEKRSLQKQLEDLSKSKPTLLDAVSDRLRSQSFSDRHGPRSKSVPTRDMGVMCGVMTRDVGVSHQQVRTRDTGMVTSTPIQPAGCLKNFAALRIDEADFEAKKTFETPTSNRNVKNYNEMSRVDNSTYDKNTISLSNLSQSSQTTDLSPIFSRKHSLDRGPLKIDNYFPDVKQLKDTSTNTDKPEPKRLTKSDFLIEDIAPAVVQTSKQSEIQKKTRTFGTETRLKMRDVRTPDDIATIIEDAVKMYKESIKKETVSRGTQCIPEVSRVPLKVDKEVQISEPFKMRSNVGIMVKPRTSEAATDAGPGPGRKSIAIGPDPVALQPISLNSMNSRSHSFNYGDTKPKRKTTKSVGVIVEGLVKTSFKSTDTVGLAPKRREFGTSPMKKKFVDVSVGDSLKPHISISCAANYCDNCKETIKNLAKQILNNNENNYRNENNNNNNKDNGVSRIPRPSHITLNNDFRKQFKRQDTYTKIPSGLIRYDADNKETYDINNKLQQLATEEHKDEKKESKEISSPEKEIITDEKGSSLPESALFEPIRDKSRVKKEPSREMRAAMKVLNDNLKKSPSKNISHQIKNATNVIQQEWFKISSTASANPLDVEDYLDCFEEYSSFLLEYIVNMTDSSGNTAMHYAVSHGNFDVVSILLDSKVCDINTANVAGYTAVMLAALAEVRNSTHASVANRLFQLADVNIRAKLHGQTALMLAVSHGRKDMTRLLLDAGAAVNIQDEDGSTALMCAAEHGHIDIVRLLLAHPDCDSSIVDVDGSSALKIALEAGHRDIGVLLYAHERVNRGTSPHSSMRRSRRGSKPTTPTGPSPSAPASPAPSRRFHSSNASLTKYSGK